ncbi:MAG: hypothetical protein AAF657_05310 [Acidobacteriota bacterium]
MTATQSPQGTTPPAQSAPKVLQINLESVTLLHGHRHQPLYFVLLLENLTGQPTTSHATINPALTSIMPGKGASGSADSELSDWLNAFVSPVFTLRKNEKKAFPGGFPLYYQAPTPIVSFYLAVMRSHGGEREIGKSMSDVMQKVSSSLGSDVGSVLSNRRKLRTAKKDETSPVTSTTTTTTTTTGTSTDGTTVTATSKPTTADDVATAAEGLITPEAKAIQDVIGSAFNSLGAALEDRGDRKLSTNLITLRATDAPPYQAGTHTDWGDDRVAMTFKIDY